MAGRRGLGIWLLPPAWVERLEKAKFGGGGVKLDLDAFGDFVFCLEDGLGGIKRGSSTGEDSLGVLWVFGKVCMWARVG